MGRTLDCGHAPTPGASPGTGYAFDSESQRTLCYACAAVLDWQRMAAHTEHFAYVSSDGHWLTTWSGERLASITGHTVSRSGWHRSEVHRWWIIDRNADRWYGQNGGAGMCIAVRRIGEWIGK